MSWLSDLFDSGDNTEQQQFQQQAIAAQIAEQQKVAAAQQAAAAAAAAQKAAWDTAQTGAKASAQNYFTERGLDPAAYTGSIDDAIKRALATVNQGDPHPEAYLQNIGQQVYEGQTNLARDRANQGISDLFSPDYEFGRVSSSLDDPFIADIVGGQRASADQYIQNLLKRGVITDTGAAAAGKGLDDQTARVRSLVSDIGSNLLAGERSDIRDIINRGTGAASTIRLGQNFDPSTYGKDVDTSFNEFMSSLGDRIKAQTPDNLYDTSGLASIAGAAQGAQNLAFDPNALAGILNPPEEDDLTKKRRTATFAF